MIGLGTVINAAGVIIGGIVGMFAGKLIKQRAADMLVSCCGLSVIFIGAAGALEKMLTVTENGLEAGGSMLIVASLAIGGILGELINIDGRAQQLGEWLKEKSGSGGDTKFIGGFLSASYTICIGAMAVIGPMNDAIYGDYSILLTKTILDTVIVMVMAASCGKGTIFSVIPLVAIQGLFTVFGKVIEPYLTAAALGNLSMVGSILIFCVGINLLFGNKIKVANMLPSLVIAVIAAYI